FGPVTPFLEAGFGNSVPDTRRVTRTYTSLGYVSNFEEGATVDLRSHFSLGASVYEVVPFGNQKIYSKVVRKGSTSSGSGNGRDLSRRLSLASGSGLTREDGANVWLGFQPTPVWNAAVGVSRSITFGYTSVIFRTGVNVGRLLWGRNSS